jgi:hypothetical protein
VFTETLPSNALTAVAKNSLKNDAAAIVPPAAGYSCVYDKAPLTDVAARCFVDDRTVIVDEVE